MKAKIVRIGNSRGIRLAEALIEEAGLGEYVELKVRDGAIVIAAAAGPRAGWADAAKLLRERQDVTFESDAPGCFDEEWKW